MSLFPFGIPEPGVVGSSSLNTSSKQMLNTSSKQSLNTSSKQMPSVANVKMSSGPRGPPKTLEEAQANINAAQQEMKRASSDSQSLNQDMNNRMRQISEEMNNAMRKQEENFKQNMTMGVSAGETQTAEKTLQVNMNAAIEKLRKENEVALQKLRADTAKIMLDKQKGAMEERNNGMKQAQDKARDSTMALQQSAKDAGLRMQKATMAVHDAINTYNTLLKKNPPRKGGRSTFRKDRRVKKQKRGTSRR